MFFQVLTKCGLLAQLVEVPNYYPGCMGSNPVEALIFFFRLVLCMAPVWWSQFEKTLQYFLGSYISAATATTMITV